MDQQKPPGIPGHRGRPRAVAFRALAVILALAPLALAEGVLAVLETVRPAPLADDPFVGFSSWQPLFVRSRDGTRYETSPAHRVFFQPQSFAARKGPREFRIFCLGGSTVQGRPFSVETSFTTWLALALKAADPARDWKTINCGGVSYASYRLARLMPELLTYQPDLFILCTGQNEFLEDRTYRPIKQVPEWVRWPLEQAARLRTFQAIEGSVAWLSRRNGGAASPRALLGPEVDALLDYKGGLEHYHRDLAWRRGVIDHFAFNVRRIVAQAQQAGVPIVLVNETANLDTPPFKSEHRADLSAAERARFEALWNEARGQYQQEMPRAVELLRQAAALDPEHAGIHFTLGKCYAQMGRLAEAKAELVLAKEEDVCPLRILEPMKQAVLEIGRAFDVPVVDMNGLVEPRSAGGIPDGRWMIDHVHPTIAGHQLVADALSERLVACGIAQAGDGWRAQRAQRYRLHLAELPPLYFTRGGWRLENLERWAAGRATRLRAPVALDERRGTGREPATPSVNVAAPAASPSAVLSEILHGG